MRKNAIVLLTLVLSLGIACKKPPDMYKLPIFRVVAYVHRMRTNQGNAAGDQSDVVRAHIETAQTLWSHGKCAIGVVNPRDDPNGYLRWPDYEMKALNDNNTEVLAGSEFLGRVDGGVSATATQINWSRLADSLYHFVANNADYKFDRQAWANPGWGNGAHFYYSYQVYERNGVVRSTAPLGFTMMGSPSNLSVVEETITPTGSRRTLAHELGHQFGLGEDPTPGKLMTGTALNGGDALTGTIDPNDTVEPDPLTTDCGRARRIGQNSKMFLKGI